MEAELKRKETSLIQVDRERDLVQDKLDEQTEANANLTNELEEA